MDDGIGERIKRSRAERGWTQDQLAAAVGVSRSAVAQWETGRSGQLTANLARIARALGVAVAELMAPAESAGLGDEMALMRLYRECSPEDRQMILHTARRLARGQGRPLVARRGHPPLPEQSKPDQ